MEIIHGDYELFFDFLRLYSDQGYISIDRNDPFILSLEEVLDRNNQFLLVYDMLNMKQVFVSMGSMRMLGISPEELTSYHFKEATHPDDRRRNEMAFSQLFRVAHEVFFEKKGPRVISSNFMMRNPSGTYCNCLIQGYFFYSHSPVPTVYLLQIYTDISWSKRIRNGFHYYLGNDLSYFRYPDESLLSTGHVFTDREFEIIKLIRDGLNSEQIAEKLFLSKYTVNTHRRNILDKTGRTQISELIFCLQETGLI